MKTVLISFLRTYKLAISPLLPPSCRFIPTCSEYAIDAITRYGALRGTRLAIWRVLRCHPFHPGGYDPVK
ncbi:MAG TPA: membrane protein insertion efficiency factor YidD [Pyrinomonadaceae bacterium]